MKKTIGIFAHVDAGKTTFSEQLLFNNGSVRKRGRVDDKNTALDTDDIEKERGITVFSGTSSFEYGNSTYYIIDTPGHSDFFPEARRTMPVIDFGIILVSATDSVQSNTELIWNRLKKYNIPTIFFINKTDAVGADTDTVITDLKTRLSQDICVFNSDDMAEKLSDCDEEFMEKYLGGTNDINDLYLSCSSLLKERKIFPLFYGSALKNDGIDDFMRHFDAISNFLCHNDSGICKAKVYKIVNDKDNNRISFLKIISGVLRVKDKINFKDATETINELRFYKGNRFELKKEAHAGDICAVTGLRSTHPGDIIGSEYIPSEETDVSVLQTSIKATPDVPLSKLLEVMKILEDEEPTLRVCVNNGTGEIELYATGKIQLEILKSQLLSRFNIDAKFSKCSVLYKETLDAAVRGCGHFEPLKHYAEVHIEIRPAKRNSGLSFKSECSTDKLTKDKQNQLQQYAVQCDHRGILTCSPLTDVEIVLLAGAVHEKHTHGGDLREALQRAVRHGLEYGKNILLEPWYEYSISVPAQFTGKLMTDLGLMSATYSAPETKGDMVTVKGVIPVSEAFEYFDELILFTKGKAQINASFCGYDTCHNPDEVINAIAYDKDSDRVNSSDSIFCSHGSGYIIPWYEAKDHMHIKL